MRGAVYELKRQALLRSTAGNPNELGSIGMQDCLAQLSQLPL